MDIQYGVDIASKRLDDLDKKILAEVKLCIENSKDVTVLDLGCGKGGLSVMLVESGAHVCAVDIADYSKVFEKIRRENNFSQDQLQFLQADIMQITKDIMPSASLCVLQRVIHYIPYEVALHVLTFLKKEVGVRKMYISATGIESDIGRSYADKDAPIEQRFCTLSDTDAKIFSITQPVCLYTPEEFMRLLQDSGWYIEECWVSAFGNIKAVCS